MIAKISTGVNTFGMVAYNHKKTIPDKNGNIEGILIGTNSIKNDSFDTIVETIQDYNNLNTNVEKRNIHISLNFHKDDIIDNDRMFEIANDYMDQIGYKDQPFAVYRHFDKEHPHVHIVSSQINSERKKINDSHIFYRSQAITRELEHKYGITKALDKNQIFTKKDIHTAIHDHLENGKHSLTAILKRVLHDVMETKPATEIDFEKKLEEYQVKRIIATDKDNNIKGHFFDLYNIASLPEEHPNAKLSKGIKGIDLDVTYSYNAIQTQIELNNKDRILLHKPVMGRAYSVINLILNNQNAQSNNGGNNKTKLSDFIIDLRKKGIDLIVKRSQTGENPNTIYGLLFKEIKSNHVYSASEIKLKTKDFLVHIDDDLKNLNTKEKEEILESSENNSGKGEEPVNDVEDLKTPTKEKISGFFDGLEEYLKGMSGRGTDDDKALKKRKKRKRGNT